MQGCFIPVQLAYRFWFSPNSYYVLQILPKCCRLRAGNQETEPESTLSESRVNALQLHIIVSYTGQSGYEIICRAATQSRASLGTRLYVARAKSERALAA